MSTWPALPVATFAVAAVPPSLNTTVWAVPGTARAAEPSGLRREEVSTRQQFDVPPAQNCAGLAVEVARVWTFREKGVPVEVAADDSVISTDVRLAVVGANCRLSGLSPFVVVQAFVAEVT